MIFDISLASPYGAQLAVALRMLGFNACCGCPTAFEKDTLTKLLQGRVDFDLLSHFDAVCSTLNHAYTRLDMGYPDARFIYLQLDQEEWKRDTLAHLQKNSRAAVEAGTPLNLFSLGRLMNIGALHCESGEFLDVCYHRRQCEVTDYFTGKYHGTQSGKKLLVYRLTDGWEPLCQFLDLPIPPVKFPTLPT